MILGRALYQKKSLWTILWLKRQLYKVNKSTKLFTAGSWSHTQYNNHNKKVPVYVGSKKDLEHFEGKKGLESLCPTGAIKVMANTITISEKNCICCMECIKASPEGIFELSKEKSLNDPDTN